MTRLFRLAQARVWLALMALTGISFAIAEELFSLKAALVAIFLVAAAKADLVSVYFMESGHAARHWQILYRLWIALVSVLLITGHLLALTRSG